MMVTEGRMRVHGSLRVEGEPRGQPHGHSQGPDHQGHQQGLDKQNLVNRIANDAAVLFLQTRLIETLSEREIGGLGHVGGACRENQSDPVQKTESLNQNNVFLGCILLDTAR
jgi:hypothetical protein